jgi:DNA-binding SARP family transcriptional activator
MESDHAIPLQISLLAEFAFTWRGRPVAVATWQRSHARRLIQLLASAPRHSEPRARVLAALWPGADEARARNRLHHTIHCIRQGWEEIGSTERPKIVVSSDRVEFVAAAGTVIDVQRFVDLVEDDSSDAQTRLHSIQQALGHYRGMLAPGWDDCAEIDARRVWLEELRTAALREASDLALELGDPVAALQYAHQLTLLPEAEIELHCRYARLLADTGRPDAALLHCRSIRGAIAEEDPAALHQLEQVIQSIQQQANRPPQTPAAPPSAAGVVVAAVVRQHCIASPTRRLFGFEALRAHCVRCIEDPFGSVVTLIGPPGAGKTLLAATLGHQLQSSLRHGALWLNCSEVNDAPALLAVLAQELAPLCGDIAADEAALCAALQKRELLIVVDGLHAHAQTARTVGALAQAGRDTRWLVTSWAALHLTSERVLPVDASQLLGAAETVGAPMPAVSIIEALCAPAWHLQDARSRRQVEQIAVALDGLPGALCLAAQHLQAMSPGELLQRLQRDPCALLRGGTHDADLPGARLGEAVVRWFERASPAARRMLALLGSCRSWLSREDISCLLGDEPADGNDSADALIEHCVRHQFVLRRTRLDLGAPRSEFRVPRISSAALRLRGEIADPTWCEQRLAAWLTRAVPPGSAPDSADPGASARWFDDHIDDADAAVSHWLAVGAQGRVAALCAAHAGHWSLPRHAARVLPWLDGLGATMDAIDPSLVARLLVERARLRVHLGQLHQACDDASQALGRVVGEPDVGLRQQAVQMIRRYSSAEPLANSPRGALSGRGVEAGESLLRVAQLAVRHGQLPQAMSVCGQSIEVFGYFGLSHGLLRAHHCQAKIAFALGNTDLALRCLGEVERVAAHAGERHQAARAALMRADVLLSQMRFAQAIDLASTLIAQPEHAGDAMLMARGVSVVAWALYGQGAYPLAHALCVDLRDKAAQSAKAELRINAEMLSALLEARLQHTAMALRRVCNAVELIAQARPLPDLQSDLVNVADLSAQLGRHDLAAPLLRSLAHFSRLPDHQLRQWVRDRMVALLPQPSPAPPTPDVSPPRLERQGAAPLALQGVHEALLSLAMS